MTRQRALVLAACLALMSAAACGGSIDGQKANPSGKQDVVTPAVTPCVGDPDAPDVLACDDGDRWNCRKEGEKIICVGGPYDIPGGSSSQWNCEDMGEFTQCESSSTDAPVTNPGWTCTKNERGKIVCIDNSPDQPSRGGPWDCVYDEVSGVTCTTTDDGEWTCRIENSQEICHKDHAETPNDSGDWQCETKDGGVSCHSDSPGQSADDSGWSCVPDRGGTTCYSPATDRPGHGGPWDCTYDELGGVTCTSSDSSDWVCVPEADGDTTCTNQHPDTPGDGSWDCYDVDGKTLCVGPGDQATNGSWNCYTDEIGNAVCEKNPEYPPDAPSSGGWNCWYDAEGNRVCSDAPPDSGGLCEPGSRRWCDGPTYCSWGTQVCLPNGTWEPACHENPNLRPDTPCACHFFYYHEECCETPPKYPGDPAGCVIPPGTNGRTCAKGNGDLCATCDSNSDCKAGAICVFTNEGETFCGRSCQTVADCCVGNDDPNCTQNFMCKGLQDQTGQTYTQCVPADNSCYH
jgi:hypothetical protein